MMKQSPIIILVIYKINPRKEFFNLGVSDIKQAVEFIEEAYEDLALDDE